MRFSILSYAKVRLEIFYLCINIGCLSPVATTQMEQATGFWTAYLLCLCFFVLGISIFIMGKRHYVVHPPKGSIIIDAFRAMWIGLRNGGSMGESIAATTLASLSSTLLITLQRPQNPHTKIVVEDASSKRHGTMPTSMSSSVDSQHAASSSSTQYTMLPTRRC